MKNKGQVAIIVLLVSAVMLSMGLTMSKRETTQIKINTNDELLKKAFDTAESGINYYLGTGGTNYSSPNGDSYAVITANTVGAGQTINFGEYTTLGGSENYWLVNHLANGDIGTSYYGGANVNVCSNNYVGQVEVILFYGSNVSRSVLNINNNCVVVGMKTNPILLSIVPLTSGGKFYLDSNGGGNFSSQGTEINSQGNAGVASIGVNATTASKQINIISRYKIPGFMVVGLMAEGSILSD